jgi:hypothetical protein
MFEIIKRPLIRKITILVIGFSLWLIIAVPLTLQYMDFGKDSYYKTGNVQLVQSSSPDQIKIDLRIQYRDLAKRVIRYYIAFQPTGSNYNNITNLWSKNIEINLIHEILRFENGSDVKHIAFDAPLKTGNLRDYPFDRYLSDIGFEAVDADTRELIPVTVNAFVYSQNTLFEFNISRDPTDSSYDSDVFDIVLSRNPIVFIFCTFNFLVNWALTIIILNIALNSIIYNRDVPPPLIPLGVLSLFALPNVRKSMPEIPEIGCAIDFLGFIWCEIILAMASCAIVWKWSMQWNSGKRNVVNNNLCESV